MTLMMSVTAAPASDNSQTIGRRWISEYNRRRYPTGMQRRSYQYSGHTYDLPPASPQRSNSLNKSKSPMTRNPPLPALQPRHPNPQHRVKFIVGSSSSSSEESLNYRLHLPSKATKQAPGSSQQSDLLSETGLPRSRSPPLLAPKPQYVTPQVKFPLNSDYSSSEESVGPPHHLQSSKTQKSTYGDYSLHHSKDWSGPVKPPGEHYPQGGPVGLSQYYPQGGPGGPSRRYPQGGPGGPSRRYPQGGPGGPSRRYPQGGPGGPSGHYPQSGPTGLSRWRQ
ncbi:hypothetical protein AMATHDRAFT_5479 [Amanita thiersii Skay4041]|uniref:Uncharacterized protein n=1 Tax=Amanita thiersii Skay4041 TaxID=703135 RepID=A0A2A9NM09_9AGAR|nr:hypothetical protein AMATHDRAFT_5479 [Amanita thiersii Skay4041]